MSALYLKHHKEVVGIIISAPICPKIHVVSLVNVHRDVAVVKMKGDGVGLIFLHIFFICIVKYAEFILSGNNFAPGFKTCGVVTAVGKIAIVSIGSCLACRAESLCHNGKTAVCRCSVPTEADVYTFEVAACVVCSRGNRNVGSRRKYVCQQDAYK